ncbi:hypothetical protein J8F10_15580 [Gemmata sp. G18]|uniref:Uncharacterized protein n=1 Tax=Gemmata palustris TaxID=2822762 RepID=A0ABS5BSI9_9BACT|nr:hypothetical protein [Gemmata palustris]MBP3956695.1 hypothetical protein [Gemmata palustris]
MRAIIPAAIVMLLVLAPRATPDTPKSNDLSDSFFHLPPAEIEAAKFEKWREETSKERGVTCTRVEYDKKVFWVVDSHTGMGNSYKKIAVYVPKKDGTFRRGLLVDLKGANSLAVAVDPKTGVLEWREQSNSDLKGEVVLSINLKVAGTGLSP